MTESPTLDSERKRLYELGVRLGGQAYIGDGTLPWAVKGFWTLRLSESATLFVELQQPTQKRTVPSKQILRVP